MDERELQQDDGKRPMGQSNMINAVRDALGACAESILKSKGT